jgi:acyl transferase domain-containing protein
MPDPRSDDHQDLEIAIIGLSCRFPGSPSVDAFWRLLRDGGDAISSFSERQLAAAGVASEVFRDPRYVPARGILTGIDLFDAPFFGISPREAERTDPQHRVFLECAWETLESAGYDPRRYAGLIGIFASAGLSSYALSQLAANPDDLEVQIGNDRAHLPGRVAYKLDLRGPSLDVQTGCSSSLVAVHLACQSLQYGECDLALAGGVWIVAPETSGYLCTTRGLLAPDGRCRAFDARAQGSVPGNGAGLVALKRCSEALADGDRVLAVIKGSAINNDGSSKVGYSAPGFAGQTAVVREALAVAGVAPESLGYVEAHGSGTALGDAVEIAALARAFGAESRICESPRGGGGEAGPAPAKEPAAAGLEGRCAIGSVKTNIGHAGVAAGIAGLIKTVLAVAHRELPPSLHFTAPNPRIDLAGSPFYVNTELRPWPPSPTPRRAGIHSFGIGGTNAHVIVEQPPAAGWEPGRSRPHQLLVLSARTPAALEAATERLASRLRRGAIDLADAAYTLAVGRGVFAHRRALVAADAAGAAAALEARDPERLVTGRRDLEDPSVLFVFPDQGSRHAGMPRALYDSEPTFRRQIDLCSELLVPHLGHDLRRLFDPPPGAGRAASEVLGRAASSQPALFAVEYALARLWMEWGVRPRAMIGHGVGEVVAACLAGVLRLRDALALAAVRGWLAEEPQTESSREDFLRQVARCPLSPPAIPCLCHLTGTWMTAAQAADPAYWARQLDPGVRPTGGAGAALEGAGGILLEVGPGRTLKRLAGDSAAEIPPERRLSSLPDPRQGQPATASMLAALGRIWLAGWPVDWSGYWRHERRRRVELPTYPFERSRYWLEPRRWAAGEPVDVTPAGDRQRVIAGIWQELLGIEAIGAEDDFFRLGGDSLAALRVLSRLERDFAVEVSLDRFFASPTVAGLAAAVDAAAADREPAGVEELEEGEL